MLKEFVSSDDRTGVLPEDLETYHRYRDQLSVFYGCLMYAVPVPNETHSKIHLQYIILFSLPPPLASLVNHLVCLKMGWDLLKLLSTTQVSGNRGTRITMGRGTIDYRL